MFSIVWWVRNGVGYMVLVMGLVRDLIGCSVLILVWMFLVWMVLIMIIGLLCWLMGIYGVGGVWCKIMIVVIFLGVVVVNCW